MVRVCRGIYGVKSFLDSIELAMSLNGANPEWV
jgi:hypothetical protein